MKKHILHIHKGTLPSSFIVALMPDLCLKLNFTVNKLMCIFCYCLSTLNPKICEYQVLNMWGLQTYDGTLKCLNIVIYLLSYICTYADYEITVGHPSTFGVGLYNSHFDLTCVPAKTCYSINFY